MPFSSGAGLLCCALPGPPQPVVVMVGDEAALPCQLEPPVDAVHMTVEWGRPDLNPRFVYVWHDGQELLVDQNPAYKGRVSLSTDKLKQGDISLKLSTVKISDNGTYRCYVPKQSKEYFVELLVGKYMDCTVLERLKSSMDRSEDRGSHIKCLLIDFW
uniref:Ig-like domain-containing protein n=1 Tax=Monopterus albus TaxID=43700 RepID=A0A3Q3QB81_MONAL